MTSRVSVLWDDPNHGVCPECKGEYYHEDGCQYEAKRAAEKREARVTAICEVLLDQGQLRRNEMARHAVANAILSRLEQLDSERK